MEYTQQVVLNWITPHQKWGIHSTYSDNLLMLTLNRGGPVVWLSEMRSSSVYSFPVTDCRCFSLVFAQSRLFGSQ
jgi:nitrate reductase alpha subunit